MEGLHGTKSRMCRKGYKNMLEPSELGAPLSPWETIMFDLLGTTHTLCPFLHAAMPPQSTGSTPLHCRAHGALTIHCPPSSTPPCPRNPLLALHMALP